MDKEKIVEHIDNNANQIHLLIEQKIAFWKEHVVFSGLWWFGVLLSIVPWIIWFLVRNKNSTDRILYVGFFVMSISVFLDILGDQFGYWHYRFNVIPIVPTYLPWDLTLMPVTIMFLIQIKPKVNPYFKALLFALLTSYAAEPFIKWLMIYNPIEWKFSYSVPIQFVIYLAAHYLSRRNKFKELT
ncbi:hypothetical protein ASG89_14440 [Paenibacillus sp. Soil766]|uniref:CBO0543 family protein n=1 Tax=Paenibacillus sp. Soil766 TaxID=1736404 RepID=UPI00070FF26A|nr:CBO0543 family protein [Paenibacillus sp. Soil766]KRE82452.1 hypothetical protein ASG89_14440 [Paenibacillus sp. Soil766]